MHFQRAELALEITDSKTAEAFFAGCFRECDPSNERLFVAHLDGRARCLKLSHYEGATCSTALPLRAIIADAVALGTAGLILAHNHPSGDSRPSAADCSATKRLATAAEAIDCSIVDHLIFGGSSCSSFRKLGLV